MKIEPLSGYILIEPAVGKDKTDSGIIIVPGKEQENTGRGIVIAVGDAKSVVKKGASVLFTKYGTAEIVDGDKEYVIARLEDILAIIKN